MSNDREPTTTLDGPHGTSRDLARDTPHRVRRELATFLFLCVVLFPALSIALIGSYGLAVWLSHAFGG